MKTYYGTYFISDLHFGHKNCLAFDNRPFKTIEECDNEIISRWNSTVYPHDNVWILGDISWYDGEKTYDIIKNLSGIKHLCVGNHDKKILEYKKLRDEFAEICEYKELSLDNGKQWVVLSHYPIPCYNKHFYGWYHLYGHVHTGFEYNMIERFQYEMTALYDKQSRMFNVGCMVNYMDYCPRTLQQIIDGASKLNG